MGCYRHKATHRGNMLDCRKVRDDMINTANQNRHTHAQSSTRRNVQLLRRQQITQLGDTLFKPRSHNPSVSVNLGSMCFIQPLLLRLFLAIWQQYCYYGPLKTAFIHSHLPSRESNLVLQKVFYSPCPMGHQCKSVEH